MQGPLAHSDVRLGAAWGTREQPVPCVESRERSERGMGRNEALVQRQSNSGPGTIERDLFLGSGLSLLWGPEWKMSI